MDIASEQIASLLVGAEWLFESAPGIAYLSTSLDHLHRRARTALGFPAEFVIHSLRHTAITRFATVNPDAWRVKAFARHASVTTSERYVHVSGRAVGQGMQRVLAVLSTAPVVALPPPVSESTEAPAAIA